MYVSFSQVKYKSDLNWLRGIGWTPPGSHKVEMARRAAELAYIREMGLQGASAQYAPGVVSRVNHSSHKFQQLCSLEGRLAHILFNAFECSLESTVLPIIWTEYVYFPHEALWLCVHLNLKEPLKRIQHCHGWGIPVGTRKCHGVGFTYTIGCVSLNLWMLSHPSPSVLVPPWKAEVEVARTPCTTRLLFS